MTEITSMLDFCPSRLSGSLRIGQIKRGLGLVREGREHGYDELKKYKNYLKYTLDTNAP